MESAYVSKSERVRAIGGFGRSLANFFADEMFTPLPPPQPGQWLDLHPERGQPFPGSYCRELAGCICIKPLDNLESEDLQLFLRFATAFFHGARVNLLPATRIESLGVESRNSVFGGVQYNARQIIRKVRKPAGSHCVLAITLKDLYPEDSWNFVYGLASNDVGVFSFIRHYPRNCSPEDAKEIMLYRGCKTLVHEIGHMFGLAHCIYYKCVMNGNNGDERSHGFLCPVCLRKLQKVLKFKFSLRFRALAEVVAERSHPKWQRLLQHYQKMLKHCPATC